MSASTNPATAESVPNDRAAAAGRPSDDGGLPGWDRTQGHPGLSLPVRWRGPIFNPSGYASEAINFILPLSERVEMGILHKNNNYSEQFVARLKDRERKRLFELRDKYPRIAGGIVIEHNPANGFSRVPDAAWRIGRTMFETDRISTNWVTACNQMDEIWVPSQFNVETFANSGVERDKLRVMPESVDETEFDPANCQPLPLPHRAACNFLSVFEWSRRKGWDVLLAAYLREFSAEDDVCLYVRSYLFGKPDGNPALEIGRRISEYAATLNLGDKPRPRIHILAEQVPQADLPRLYKAADCLVAPSRGEGWGRPHHEAMMMGLPVIATGWSGNTEFMRPENSFLIDFQLVDTAGLEPELRHYRNQRWAEPSEASLRQAMRLVQQNPEQARAKGGRARQDMLRHYTRGVVADRMLARLREIEFKLVTPACPAVTARAMEIPSLPAGQQPARLRMTWEGTFLDFGSLSHVNREMTAALSADRLLDITRVSRAKSPVPLELKNLARRIQSEPPRRADVTVRHAWPPEWKLPAEGAWVMMQPWEFGVLPADWVRRLAQVHEIWVPSQYARRVYVESGIPPSKVKIVPNGIDPGKFRPDLPRLPLATEKQFKFLFVGGTIHRKGPDLLLAAYLQRFSAADDVCLVIKDFGSRTFYQGQTLEAEIAAARRKPNAPEILHLTDEIPAETMPRLYAACDCLVHPYRGEGFSLPVLEAMACGLPVIVTGGGATDDFATDEHAFRLPALRRQIGDQIGGLKLCRNGWWLEPAPAAIGERMRWIVAHRAQARKMGSAASDYVRREWTWERAARIAGQRAQDLAARHKAEVAVLAARRARKPGPITLPATARIGDLAPARELLMKKDLPGAWSAALAAIQSRPCHPEAYLLLAEIAGIAGDGACAIRCARHARKLAPDWKPARTFRSDGLRRAAHLPWMVLPTPVSDAPAPLRLSVCLIVKNEEEFLGRCLASVCELAAQIVVVDTGSTDRTLEIARQFKAEAHHFAWCDDFAAARNAALEHATGDWVLSLDADEELLPEHRSTILQEMQADGVMGYRLPILNKGRELEGRSYVPRLFRNAPGLFYVGCVHEQVFSSIEVRCRQWGLRQQLGGSVLFHHGYTKDVMESRDKIARNLRLLERAIEELPNDPNLLMNYGLELVRSGQLETGLEQYVEATRCMAALPPDQIVPELRETLLTQLTTHLLAAREFESVAELWETPFVKSGGMTASHHFGLGLAYMELNRPADAAEQMRLCLAKRRQPALSPVNVDILKAAPNHCLARCLCALGRKEAAAEAFAAALSDEPSSLRAGIDFARFQAGQGRPLDALKLLNSLAAENPAEPSVWQLGGEIALSRPEFLEFARDWTGEAVKQMPEHPVLLAQRAEALLLTGDIEGALPLWRRAASPRPGRQAAAVVLCELLTGGCRRHFPAAEEAAVSREMVKWYRQLIAAGAHSPVRQLDGRMEEARAVAPGFVGVWEAATQKARGAMVAA
jgi:glycosyltransferase involved in cell wall biosynthesis/tetratricopeptide (TPR) repeat protein